ncbi:protease modulator HflC [Moritella sp. 24]|uniref:protease modulator HflC n=1 Tax=Moritella sp. 24 TaxID=2746230 RepID=UPI001BAC8844|nr:protease modulator HflC [Moritella sp. 24]QUM75155.1 protease modulator HflC [Moritella sp. 24]
MNQLKAVILVLVLLLGFSSFFVVNEGERALVVRFGKVLKTDDAAKVYLPGLNFKVPFIDSIRVLSSRLQTLDGQADRFVTSEKKDLIIDSYVKWRIEDFETFYLATNGGNFLQAESLLQRKITNGLRNEIGNRTIKDIVSGQRGQVMETALKRMARSSELGILVEDVRIKQINLPQEVSNSIFQRMSAERHAVAKEHRSQGYEQAEILKAEVDAKVTVMLADANRLARQLRGEGDAKAARIYADTYNKDAEFYGFLRSLEAYSKSFSSKSDVLVVSPESDFFNYMKGTSLK